MPVPLRLPGSTGCYTARVNKRESDPVVEIIEIEADPAGLASEPAAVMEQPSESSNPDAWLDWALVIGLLALFLLCAVLILLAWNNR